MSLMHRWSKCSFRPDKMIRDGKDNDDYFETQFSTGAPSSGCPDPKLLSHAAAPKWPLGYLRIRNFAGSSAAIPVSLPW